MLETAAQYYLHTDVSALSDQEFVDVIARLTWIRQDEKNQSENQCQI